MILTKRLRDKLAPVAESLVLAAGEYEVPLADIFTSADRHPEWDGSASVNYSTGVIKGAADALDVPPGDLLAALTGGKVPNITRSPDPVLEPIKLNLDGGCIHEVTGLQPGQRLEVRDYDIEGLDAEDGIEEDEYGAKYHPIVFPGDDD